jgi:hypothetical protein
MSEGLEVGATAKLTLALNSLAGEMAADRERRRRAATVIRQVPFAAPITLVGGAGVLQQPGTFGVPQGFYWCVRRLAAQGFSAGTVTVNVDNANGEPLPPFPQAGVFTFGRAEVLLHPMSQLVFTAAGITGTVQIYGAADAFESWYLPTYLG